MKMSVMAVWVLTPVMFWAGGPWFGLTFLVVARLLVWLILGGSKR